MYPRGPMETYEPTPDLAPTTGTKKSWLANKDLWPVVVGGVSGAAVAVALIHSFASEGRELAVNFSLIDRYNGVTCAGGLGGYDDVGPGMAVVVRNNDGQVIGTSALDVGGAEIARPGGGPGGCTWTAVVHDVPAGEDYYSISVGRRGEQIYTGEQLEDQSWEIDLSLGGP